MCIQVLKNHKLNEDVREMSHSIRIPGEIIKEEKIDKLRNFSD